MGWLKCMIGICVAGGVVVVVMFHVRRDAAWQARLDLLTCEVELLHAACELLYPHRSENCGREASYDACPSSVTRRGVVKMDRFNVLEVSTAKYGETFRYVVYHQSGGLHPVSGGSFTAQFGLAADFDLAADNLEIATADWLVRAEEVDIYWEWFDRFEKGQAELNELDTLFPFGQ